MRILLATAFAALFVSATVSAQVTAPPPAPAPSTESQQPAPPAGAAAPLVPAPTTPPVPAAARAFTAPTGLIFNAVRAERVADFEMVIGYLEAALSQSADPQVRAQAKGWRVFKAAEPGPNGTVLYVFVFDPAVPGADYALGPILSDAFPNQIEQIWKLYQGALAGGGSLLNLTPVQPPPLPPAPSADPAVPVAPPASGSSSPGSGTAVAP